MDIHHELWHAGINRVIAESRRRFWVIKARRLAKSIAFNCTTCRRWRGKGLNQLMCDLPKERIDDGCSPFENVAVDYFGPFLLKFGRKQRIKAYGIVFVCLTTRAIYLDLATNLSTDNFLLAFRRLISLYGQPRIVRSDNGTNFRGAAREISEMIKNWKSEVTGRSNFKEFLTKYGIKWILLNQ